jgi:hypothetical protein
VSTPGRTEVSPIAAAQQAVEHTRRDLFPFQLERWLALGFVAFLDQCGRTGGGGGVPSPGGGWSDGGEGIPTGDPTAWIAANLALVVGIAVGVLIVIVAIAALVLWLGSRGIFMYIDNVATRRADVSRPWREHAEAAGSLFAWRFGIAMGTLVIAFVLVAAGLAAYLGLSRGSGSSAAFIAVVVLLILLFVVVVIASTLVSVALRDFVAPLQLSLRVGCGPAFRVLVDLVQAHPVPFLLYVLLKIAFTMVGAIALFVAACLTCCCALLPVITQTVLQPLFYFERAWSLYLLRQMGHDVLGSAAVGAAEAPWPGPSAGPVVPGPGEPGPPPLPA